MLIDELVAAGATEVIDVRCAGGTVAVRVLRKGTAAPEAPFVVEVTCRLCREIVYREIGGSRADILVVHYVDAGQAKVVATRVIRSPRPAARDINRGGRILPAAVYQRAIAAHTRSTHGGQRVEAMEAQDGL